MWLSPWVSRARAELPSGRWLRLEERRPEEDITGVGSPVETKAPSSRQALVLSNPQGPPR